MGKISIDLYLFMKKFVIALLFLNLVLIPVFAETELNPDSQENVVPVDPPIDVPNTEALINKDGLEYFAEDLVLDIEEDEALEDDLESELDDDLEDFDDEFDDEFNDELDDDFEEEDFEEMDSDI